MTERARTLPEPLRGQVVARLEMIAALVAVGEPVVWAEEHDEERGWVRLSAELDGGRLCELCAASARHR